MENARHFDAIFSECIRDYRERPDVDRPVKNPYGEDSLEGLLYGKSWIDNVQWDLEDLIRDPEIVPAKALELKRRIDRSNQDRTDRVEKIDDAFETRFSGTAPLAGARLNTESVAWALDRLSILLLKIYHMALQSRRTDADPAHRARCLRKLEVLTGQREDLLRAIDELIADVLEGKRIVRVYRQMKMYNDPSMSPVLHQKRPG